MSILLHPDEPAVFTHKPGTIPGLFVVAEHAGYAIPKSLRNLDCDIDFSSVHFGCDVGVAAMMAELNALGAETFASNYSRAVLDPNRMLDDPTLIPDRPDGILIPANVEISARERQARIDTFYHPFHTAFDKLVADKRFCLSVHSMEERLEIDSLGHKTDGKLRPSIALLFMDKENDLAEALAEFFRGRGLSDIGMNFPYTAKDESRPTPIFLKHQPRMPIVLIEFRNDLLREQADINAYAKLLLEAIQEVALKA